MSANPILLSVDADDWPRWLALARSRVLFRAEWELLDLAYPGVLGVLSIRGCFVCVIIDSMSMDPLELDEECMLRA